MNFVGIQELELFKSKYVSSIFEVRQNILLTKYLYKK